MTVISGGSLTSVAGIRVGHWSDPTGATGCTVITLPIPNTIAGEVRGAAPCTRESALLMPGMSVEGAHALLFSGGSAFGLAAADGVMKELEADGIGYPTPAGVVPIVPAATIFDLTVVDASIRPTANEGSAAYRAASSDAPQQGRVGAGTAATISKWRGMEAPGGLGSAAVKVGKVTVSALVVLNAAGDAFSLEGEALTGGECVPGPLAEKPPLGENTTLVAVATDAQLGRAELSRICVRAHDALAVCIRPVHTAFDGDAVFAVATGTMAEDGPKNYLLAEGAFEAVGRAVEVAARSASGGR